jgi:PAS domain S-box-containing protein
MPKRYHRRVDGVDANLFSEPIVRRMGEGRRMVALRKDGVEIPVEAGLNRIDTEEGRFSVIAIVDITARAKLQQELVDREARFRATFEQAAVGIAHVTTQGRFLRVNRRFCQILDRGQEDLYGAALRDITDPDFREVDAENIREVLAGGCEAYSVEKLLIKGDGANSWVNMTVSLARNGVGDADYLIAVIEDITSRKGMEAELQALNVDLDKRVRDRTAALARSNRELEEFAYVASHDLQEPLRMVASYVQLLERRYGDLLDGAAHEFMQFAVDGTVRMKRLINDLLTYSRVETEGRECTPLELGTVLDEVEANLRSSIDESGATIEREELPTVLADEVQMIQLLQNIVGNAIKYCGDVAPRITIGATEDDGFWEIYIRDNGIGIEPRHAARVFQIFQRLHNGNQYEGTGIGLAICKKIVERYGGTISVTSNVGQGSTFRFSLPKASKLVLAGPQ